MIGTLGVRYELPSQVERFRPYVAAGLGINNTDQEFRLEQTMFTPAFNQSASHTGYAFSAGGGASVRLAGQFWGDVDANTSACRATATSCGWAEASAFASDPPHRDATTSTARRCTSRAAARPSNTRPA